MLYREEQRVSLRAFLRTALQNSRIAESKVMEEFLTARPVELNEEELIDVEKRKSMDAVRIEEQKRFYEIARQRAAELDVYMEQFRRDIVESSKSPASSGVTWFADHDFRWINKAVRRDPGKAFNCRAQPAISEIRRVAPH